jgi:L-seryl-tRNA(Ser) seleniumtransferase
MTVGTSLQRRGDSRRSIPSLDRLVRHERAGDLIDAHGRDRVVAALRAVLQHCRTCADAPSDLGEAELLAECAQRLAREDAPTLKPVLNLSGTVLHTNLGRAVLARSAVEAATQAMTEATNLEFDVVRGERGERDAHVEELLCRLTGAEAATVVNNNAAAVLLLLATVAARKEVVVSRGELVEIGGAFRVPDVMTRAGCRLREVGTTNRTHLRDYEEAVGPRTAAFMKVHASNYAIQGFTAEVHQGDLAGLARRLGLPLLIDLGSGSILDLERFGLPPEPTPRQAIADGATAVTFSGDKLLGGPQSGIVVGSRELVRRLRANPLKRALRVDKITLAALAATLRLYLNPERACREIPTLRLLVRPRADIREQAIRLLPLLQSRVGEAAKVAVEDCMSQIGSGSRPIDLLPSAALVLRPAARGPSVAQLASSFRRLPVPVIGRIQKGAFLLDLRCLDDEATLARQFDALQLQPDPGA